MAKAKKFDLEKYVIKVCKEAGVDPEANVFEGTDLSSDTMFLTYEDLLAIVIIQNWDPAFHPKAAGIFKDEAQFRKLIRDYKLENGLVPIEMLVEYIYFAKSYFQYGLFITNIFEASNLYNQIEYILDSDESVYISGETGTGKEIIAKIIHENSTRKDRKFIPIICAGMPDELLYGELFGYVKGAFTGAVKAYDGYIAEAKGGTLFLDEVGDMGPKSQTALLRFLNDKKYRRLGDIKELDSDCRIICASNEGHESLLKGKESKMRLDFFHRISKHSIGRIPLRSSKVNIPLIIYLYSRKLTDKNIEFPYHLLKHMICDYTWPGNYRELVNNIENYVIRFLKWDNQKQINRDNFAYMMKDRSSSIFKGESIGVIRKIPMELRYYYQLIDLYNIPEFHTYMRSMKKWVAEIFNLNDIPFIDRLRFALADYDKEGNLHFNLDMYVDYSVINSRSTINEIYEVYKKIKSGKLMRDFDVTANNPYLNPYYGIKSILEDQEMNELSGETAILQDLSLKQLAADGATVERLIKTYLQIYFKTQQYASRNNLAEKLGYDDARQLNTLLEKIGLDWPIPPRGSSKRPTNSRKSKK